MLILSEHVRLNYYSVLPFINSPYNQYLYVSSRGTPKTIWNSWTGQTWEERVKKRVCGKLSGIKVRRYIWIDAWDERERSNDPSFKLSEQSKFKNTLCKSTLAPHGKSSYWWLVIAFCIRADTCITMVWFSWISWGIGSVTICHPPCIWRRQTTKRN